MTDIAQCPTCVDEKAATGQPISADEFPLAMDPETTNWRCENGHMISTPELSRILTNTPSQLEPKMTPQIKTPQKAGEKPKASNKRDEKPAPKQASGGVPAGRENGNAEVIRADGDCQVVLFVPETYVHAAKEWAAEAGQTLTQWSQERFEYMIENEFQPVRKV